MAIRVRLGIVLLMTVAWGCERLHPATGAYATSHPQLVAFARPDLAASDQPGSSPALAQLELALSDTVRCLEMDDLRVAVVYRPRVEVDYSGEIHSFAFEDVAAGDAIVGIVLVATDRPPIVVYASEGESSLQQRLRAAAASYFGNEGCRLEL